MPGIPAWQKFLFSFIVALVIGGYGLATYRQALTYFRTEATDTTPTEQPPVLAKADYLPLVDPATYEHVNMLDPCTVEGEMRDFMTKPSSPGYIPPGSVLVVRHGPGSHAPRIEIMSIEAWNAEYDRITAELAKIYAGGSD